MAVVSSVCVYGGGGLNSKAMITDWHLEAIERLVLVTL